MATRSQDVVLRLCTWYDDCAGRGVGILLPAGRVSVPDALIPLCTLGHGDSLPEGLPQPSATDRDEEAGDAHDDICTDTRSARPRRSL
jgi:hypothetical protein